MVLDSTMVGLTAAYLVNLLNISRHNTFLCGFLQKGTTKIRLITNYFGIFTINLRDGVGVMMVMAHLKTKSEKS